MVSLLSGSTSIDRTFLLIGILLQRIHWIDARCRSLGDWLVAYWMMSER